MSYFAANVNCPNCDQLNRLMGIKPKTFINMHAKFTCSNSECKKRYLATLSKNPDKSVAISMEEIDPGDL